MYKVLRHENWTNRIFEYYNFLHEDDRITGENNLESTPAETQIAVTLR